MNIAKVVVLSGFDKKRSGLGNLGVKM